MNPNQESFFFKNSLKDQTRTHLSSAKNDMSLEANGARRGITHKRLSSDRFDQNFLDVIPNAIFVIDRLGFVSQHNFLASTLLNTSLLGKQWCDLVSACFLVNPTDGSVSLPDGRRVQVNTSPIKTKQAGQIVSVVELSDTRQLQDIQNRQWRLTVMGEMMATLAHQIRTPISCCLLYVSRLKKTMTVDPLQFDSEVGNQGNRISDHTQRIQSKTLDNLKDRIQHMEHMISDMLEYAKGSPEHYQENRLSVLLSQIETQAEAELKRLNCRLSITNDMPDALLFCNRDAMAGAIQNLIENAAQACFRASKDGDVSLSTLVIDKNLGQPMLEIRVIDNGLGISDENSGQIFEPFYTTRSEGTGLGLAIVKTIVETHRGAVWLENSDDDGSCFCIRLPLLNA